MCACQAYNYFRGGAEPDRDHSSLSSCGDSCTRFRRRRVASMSWSQYVSGASSTVSSAKHTYTRRSPTPWGFLCWWYVHRDLAITTRRHSFFCQDYKRLVYDWDPRAPSSAEEFEVHEKDFNLLHTVVDTVLQHHAHMISSNTGVIQPVVPGPSSHTSPNVDHTP